MAISRPPPSSQVKRQAQGPQDEKAIKERGGGAGETVSGWLQKLVCVIGPVCYPLGHEQASVQWNRAAFLRGTTYHKIVSGLQHLKIVDIISFDYFMIPFLS